MIISLRSLACGSAAPVDLVKTCAGSLTRRWQVMRAARPWLADDDAALVARAYATAGAITPSRDRGTS